jgi:DNA-binding NarL/FixJ family response regulator
MTGPQKSEPIRVFIIGSHRLPRAALRALVESRPGFEVTGEADTCADAMKSTNGTNILLIDLPDSDATPLRDLRRLLSAATKARPIVLTLPLEPSVRTEIVRLGAMGLVTKDESVDLLFTAMETVANQHVAWIDRTTMTEVLRTIGEPDKPKPAASELLAGLTRRERDIINITLLGLKNRQVADRLFISETTVRHHLTSIFTKLGVRGRFELLRFAYQNGLTKPPAKEVRKS